MSLPWIAFRLIAEARSRTTRDSRPGLGCLPGPAGPTIPPRTGRSWRVFCSVCRVVPHKRSIGYGMLEKSAPSKAKAPVNFSPKARKPKPKNGAAAAKQAKYVELASAGGVISNFPSAEPNVALVDLKPGLHQCRWPCVRKNKVTTHFCGKPTATDSSYCEEHLLLSINPEARKRKLADSEASARFRGRAA
jgi:hypothetical protein